MKRFIALGALMVLLGAATSQAAPHDACAYTYADDYSGDAVVLDSYAHSYIASSYCYNCFNGYLMFDADSTGDRALGFYPQGQGYGGLAAHLTYLFPRDGSAGGMVGRLEFDLLPCRSGGGGIFNWADVKVGYDAVGVASEHVTQAGHYVYDLNLPSEAGKVYLTMYGYLARLDNLVVCLDAPTPTRGSSWGGLKVVYR